MLKRSSAALSANLAAGTARKPAYQNSTSGIGYWQGNGGPSAMPGEVLHRLRPAPGSSRFLCLTKLCPTCLLSERNPSAPGGRQNTLHPALPAGIRIALPPRKLLQNGNSLRELISLPLRVPVILAEPSQRFTYVCHFGNPLGLLAGAL
jgi:hypothetical protein